MTTSPTTSARDRARDALLHHTGTLSHEAFDRLVSRVADAISSAERAAVLRAQQSTAPAVDATSTGGVSSGKTAGVVVSPESAPAPTDVCECGHARSKHADKLRRAGLGSSTGYDYLCRVDECRCCQFTPATRKEEPPAVGAREGDPSPESGCNACRVPAGSVIEYRIDAERSAKR